MLVKRPIWLSSNSTKLYCYKCLMRRLLVAPIKATSKAQRFR